MARKTDLAWAAGLFEGEGCVSVREVKGHPYAYLILGTTDEDVVARFHKVVECGRLSVRPLKPPHKDLHLWQTGRHEDVRRLIEVFRPYMGARRSAKMDEALAALDTPRRQRHRARNERGVYVKESANV